MMKRKILGPEKAAILLMDLGEEKAAQVLANMDEREVQTLSNYMSTLSNLDMKMMDSVNKDFYALLESETVRSGRSGMISLNLLCTKQKVLPTQTKF